ncbi:MAG: glutamate ligase domain-containing protein, partial [Macrococcoides caseolyticum]
FKVNDDTYIVPTLGSHNARNATIAIAIGSYLGLSPEQINHSLQQLELTGMRMEQLEGKDGALLINDAYNASPTSMKAAIDTVSQMDSEVKIIVFGDVLELGEDEVMYHKQVGAYLQGKQIDYVFTTGNAARHISKAAEPFTTVQHFDTKEALTNHLKGMLNAHTSVLFKASRGMKLETIINELL